MSISHPKFAVAVLVLRKNKDEWEVLMVARKDDHSKWSLPGGKLDPAHTVSMYVGGEKIFEDATPLRAAEPPRRAGVRELEEETGLRCEPEQLVELGTVLDSGGYLTTFYLLTANYPLPDTFEAGEGEAPVEWGSPEKLFEGPFGAENRARFEKLGLLR